MVRDINEQGLERTKVICLRGGTTADVRESLADLNVNNFETVVVHAGTNNCTNERKFETAEADLRGLVDDVQRRTPNTAVILSTVCPRADADGRHQRKVDKLNSKIRRLSESKGCLLVDNDTNFKIHNVADTSLLNSGKLHLNKSGTRWLLMNINKVHTIIRSSTRRSSSIAQQDQRQRGYSPAETRPRHPRTTPRRRNFTYDQSRAEPLCQKCGLSNHTTRDCHHRGPVRCNDCHELGHKSYNESRPFLCQFATQNFRQETFARNIFGR